MAMTIIIGAPLARGSSTRNMPLTVTANPQVDTNGAQGVVDISLHHQQKLLIFETQRLIMFAGNVLYRLISYRMINFRRIA